MTSSPTDSASAFTLDAMFEQARSFVTGILSLDPEQAALRAGFTLLVVIGAALLIWGLRLTLKALTERLAPAPEGEEPRKRLRIGRWSLGLARLVIMIAASLIVLRLWGLDLSDVREGPLGAFFASATRIAIILVIALAAIEVSQLAIVRVFTRIAERARNPRRAGQLRTFAPLLAGVATSTLVLIAAMMALSEIGVEIGPLIAGAGIIGLAVGFGAQT
ncbi:MAG: mechanosensitive ion channel, partial [Alphaproteobacteria bacterium]|nr:mechanosensitive ion channel [Alphaproteobacteria bacterium]